MTVIRKILFNHIMMIKSALSLFTVCACVCSCASNHQKDIDIPLSVAVAPDSDLVATNAKSIELEIHRQINTFRAKKGLSPLSYNNVLANGADEHSIYLRSTAKKANKPLLISHDHFEERISKLHQGGGPLSVAENVGVVKGVSKYHVASTLVKGWIESKGHYKNIVGDYSMSGVGVTIGEDNTIYATQLFGAQ